MVTTDKQTLDVLEKRRSFADMKMAKVTNRNLQSIEVPTIQTLLFSVLSKEYIYSLVLSS